MEDILVPAILFGTLFVALPWLFFHYLTKWKQASGMTVEDENLLDELHMIARRLDERMTTIERIIDADRPSAQVTHLHQKSIAKEL